MILTRSSGVRTTPGRGADRLMVAPAFKAPSRTLPDRRFSGQDHAASSMQRCQIMWDGRCNSPKPTHADVSDFVGLIWRGGSLLAVAQDGKGPVGDGFAIVAIGPEAMVNRGFDRAVRTARQRLSEIEE